VRKTSSDVIDLVETHAHSNLPVSSLRGFGAIVGQHYGGEKGDKAAR
jgi:hypothetical protein